MKPLTYATVCSGIECMSVAAHGLPLRPVFFAEVEPYPCAVLRYRFPSVPNLGDMTKITFNPNTKEITNGHTTLPLPDGGLDILAGGTPCQDFSVAGRRRGADGDRCDDGGTTRSSLCYNFIRLLREIRPRWFIFENVPGMLTTNEGRDFAHFLVALGESGYGDVSWRILDAQYVRVDGMERAVPQRRRRVWVVGRAGAAAGRSAEVLLEPTRDPGDTPPRRIVGQATSARPCGRARGDATLVGDARWWDGGNAAQTLTRLHADGSDRLPDKGKLSLVVTNSNGGDVMPTISAAECKQTESQKDKGGGYVIERRAYGINANGVTKTVPMPFRDECAETLAVKHQGGVAQSAGAFPAPDRIVRRLTPVECERLMGLPDGWTRVRFAPDEITDALVADFRRIHDAFAAMTAKPGKAPKPRTAAWVRNWLGRISDDATAPDAPRYKACGNGWATNQPRWILLNLLELVAPGWRYETVNGAEALAVRTANTGANGSGVGYGVAHTLDRAQPEAVIHGANTFVKATHAHGTEGEGERWVRGEVAGCRNTFDNGDARTQEVVVHGAAHAEVADTVGANSGAANTAGGKVIV